MSTISYQDCEWLSDWHADTVFLSLRWRRPRGKKSGQTLSLSLFLVRPDDIFRWPRYSTALHTALYAWDGPLIGRCVCTDSMQEVRIWRGGESYLYCDIDTVLLYNSTDAGHNTAAGCHTILLCPQVGISMIKLLTLTQAFGQHLPTWTILSYQTRKLVT